MGSYTIKDVTEMGHTEYTGGSIWVEMFFKEKTNEVDKYVKIIDYLDHCTVTYDDKYLDFTQRFFLIKPQGDLFKDVVSIISHFVGKEVESIKVSIGKESYTSPVVASSVIKFSVEG